MKTLYIFVTSERPDQYLNPISFCIHNKDMLVKRIMFVQISKESGGRQIQAEALCRDVYDFTHYLSLGTYRYFTGNQKGIEERLSNHYNDEQLAAIKAWYGSCLIGNINWDCKRISYSELKQYIYGIVKLKDRTIIDISCVSKSYIGDVISCCLLKNFSNLYVFDLLIEPNFVHPWKTLIHDLEEEGEKFDYVNLVKQPVFQENSNSVLIRTVPLTISVVATLIFIVLALAANFLLGNNNSVIQALSIVSAVLGIVAFFLVFFPVRGV